MFKWIFLIPIELIHDPKHVQIVCLFFYWPEYCKNNWGQKLRKFQFLDTDEVKFEMHECGMCEQKFQKVDEHIHKKAAVMFIS